MFSEDVIRFRESETENHLIENEDGSFTFTDPDDALLAIRVGDKLAHTALDGSVTVILVLSRTLDEDTGALTLTHDENTEAVDFFETVRIHATEDPNAAPIVDTDSGAPGVEYLPEESVSDEVEQITGWYYDDALEGKVKVTILAAGFALSFSDDRALPEYTILTPEQMDDDQSIAELEATPTLKRVATETQQKEQPSNRIVF